MARYATIEERVEEDRRNDRSRPAIGTNVSENVGPESKAVASVLMLSSCAKLHETETKRMLEQKDYDSPGKFTGRIGNSIGNNTTMETLSRFSMIKSRIY